MLRNKKGSVFYQQLIPAVIATVLILLVALLAPVHSGASITLASQSLPPSGVTPSTPEQTIWNQLHPFKVSEPLAIITTLPPRPGDLVYKLNLSNWLVGHVGIYTGEFTYNGNTARLDNAPTFVDLYRLIVPPEEDNCVIQGNQYNVVEVDADGVIYRYYQPISLFAEGDVFIGARTVAGEPLTPAERQAVVDFVTSQLGKHYAYNGVITTSGACQGHLVKGPDQYMCVGLAEMAYELIGRDIVPETNEEDWRGLSPFRQFQHTKPVDYVEVEAGTVLTFCLKAVGVGFAFNYLEDNVSWSVSGKPPQAILRASPEDGLSMEFVWETLPTDSSSEYKVTFAAVLGDDIATQTITIKVIPAT